MDMIIVHHMVTLLQCVLSSVYTKEVVITQRNKLLSTDSIVTTNRVVQF